jgi:hypothetical protein
MLIGIVVMNMPNSLATWLLQQATWVQTYLRRLLLQAALERAYCVFARRHPRWAASLFDRCFLHSAAAPLFAYYAQTGRPPTPADLALAWLDQLGLDAPARLSSGLAEVTVVAADFLDYLAAELEPYQMPANSSTVTLRPSPKGLSRPTLPRPGC